MDYVPSAAAQRVLARLSRHELLDRLHAARALSAVRGLRYLDDHGHPRTIDLALAPWLLTPQQVAFFCQLVRVVVDALVRLPRLYAERPELRALLPFDATQESWLRLSAAPSVAPLAVLGRLDSTAQYHHAAWRRRFELLEPNAVGVGGVHYAPTACSILLDILGDQFERAFPGRRVAPMANASMEAIATSAIHPGLFFRTYMPSVSSSMDARLLGWVRVDRTS